MLLFALLAHLLEDDGQGRVAVEDAAVEHRDEQVLGAVQTLGVGEPGEPADARTAIADAVRHDGRLLVVPRRADGGYSRVGTIAKVEQDPRFEGRQVVMVLAPK